MDAFADTLHLLVRRSRYARVWTVWLHGAAALVCALLAWHRPALWLLLALVGVSFGHAWRAANLRLATSIVSLRWGADGRWRWTTRDGRGHAGVATAAEVYGAGLVVLTLRADGRRWRRRRCLLFADALDADRHRRLRARLRVAPPIDDPSAQA